MIWVTEMIRNGSDAAACSWIRDSGESKFSGFLRKPVCWIKSVEKKWLVKVFLLFPFLSFVPSPPQWSRPESGKVIRTQTPSLQRIWSTGPYGKMSAGRSFLWNAVNIFVSRIKRLDISLAKRGADIDTSVPPERVLMERGNPSRGNRWASALLRLNLYYSRVCYPPQNIDQRLK